MSSIDIATLAAGVVDDPDIQERLLDLCHAALDDAEYMLKHGTPEQKGPLVKSLMSMMTRPKAQDTGADEHASLRSMLMAENDRMVRFLVGDVLDDVLDRESAEPVRQLRVG